MTLALEIEMPPRASHNNAQVRLLRRWNRPIASHAGNLMDFAWPVASLNIMQCNILLQKLRRDEKNGNPPRLRLAAHGDRPPGSTFEDQLWWPTVCLQSPRQRHRTDYQQQSDYLTLCSNVCTSVWWNIAAAFHYDMVTRLFIWCQQCLRAIIFRLPKQPGHQHLFWGVFKNYSFLPLFLVDTSSIHCKNEW